MSLEGREVPHGYDQINLDSIKARGVMPTGWFFRLESAPGVRAYFMTRESISRERIFHTGLTLNALFGISRVSQLNPSEFAGRFITNFTQQEQPNLDVLSNLEEIREGHLVTFRQKFRHDGTLNEDPRSGPTMMYFSVTGDVAKDRAYIALFETPTEKWRDDEKIAKTMIEGLTFGQ